jgi:hypothetical protein
MTSLDGLTGDAALCLAGGALAAATIRNPARAEEGKGTAQRSLVHCALDAPPQRATAAIS